MDSAIRIIIVFLGFEYCVVVGKVHGKGPINLSRFPEDTELKTVENRNILLTRNPAQTVSTATQGTSTTLYSTEISDFNSERTIHITSNSSFAFVASLLLFYRFYTTSVLQYI